MMWGFGFSIPETAGVGNREREEKHAAVKDKQGMCRSEHR